MSCKSVYARAAATMASMRVLLATCLDYQLLISVTPSLIWFALLSWFSVDIYLGKPEW
jgi:hypothetical protein